MTKRQLPLPTDAELDLLRVLWNRGPVTVRQVFETLNATREVGYTTVLKLLQIMAEKGLVERDESQRSHVYRAAARAARTQKQLVSDLMDRAFAGSTEQLVLQALASKRASKEELDQIRKLLDQLEGGER